MVAPVGAALAAFRLSQYVRGEAGKTSQRSAIATGSGNGRQPGRVRSDVFSTRYKISSNRSNARKRNCGAGPQQGRMPERRGRARAPDSPSSSEHRDMRTARPDEGTVRPDEGTVRPDEGTVRPDEEGLRGAYCTDTTRSPRDRELDGNVVT
jgi:hypothetical protein